MFTEIFLQIRKTTKIHTVVDGLGNPIYFQLSAGNIHDSTVAVDVLSHVDISSSNVLVDKAYGTKEQRDSGLHSNEKW